MADRQEQIQRLRERHLAAPGSKAFAPLADQLRRAGQTEEALVLLEDGLSRHPDYLTAMVILGRTLLDAQRLDHARKVLGRVLDLDPDNFVALGLLARDACQYGKWAQAVPWLERLVSLEPHVTDWPLLLEKARTAQPVAVSQERAGDLPAGADKVSSGIATMTMVDIYLAQGYYGKALDALRLIRAREPERTDIKSRMAEVLALMDLHGEGNPPAATGEAPGKGPHSGPPAAGTRRRLEKQHFNDWIDRLQSGESDPL